MYKNSGRIELLRRGFGAEIGFIRSGQYGFFAQLASDQDDAETREALGLALTDREATIKEIDEWQRNHQNEERLIDEVCRELGG